jgi:DNA repair photolyase
MPSPPCIPGVAVHGRGAQTNATGRFESLTREAFDDGWTELDDEPRKLRTVLHLERARTIITTNDSPDIGFGQSINPYRGCEHGCIYCYARPAHAYVGFSPGLDFESQLFFKPDAAKLLEKELSRKSYVCRPIHVGGNTDPYQPIEKGLRITRGVVEVMERFNHPFSIITKNAMITRDIDLYASLAERKLVRIAVSVTTLDRKLARAMEPRAATPERRLSAIRQLAQAGVPCAVSVAPIIPGLNDHEIEAILERAAEAGASNAHFTVLRLPLEIKDLFREWLEAERPERAARVMSLVRQMRGGKDYDAAWNTRMRGEGPIAHLIEARFRTARRRVGLERERLSLDVGKFRVPAKSGDQMDLFSRRESAQS